MKLANINESVTHLLMQVRKAPVLCKYLGTALYLRKWKSVIFQPDTHTYPAVDSSALCVLNQLLLSPKVLEVEFNTNYKEHMLELDLELI